MAESLDSWFKREVVVHEEALMRFIRRNWKRNPEEVHDLRQETYMRVYEAAAKSRPPLAKPFLFITAKHLMTDRIRRQRVVTIDTIGDLDALNVTVDDLSPERQIAARQELRVLAQIFDSLPPRCREAVWLRRVDRLSQKEIAQRLGIAQKTVEGHLRKGIKRLADAFFGNDLSGLPENEPQDIENEHKHGKQQTD